MTRLTSIEKGGYYAFPDEHLSAVASLVAPSKRGGKFLDPCAGEGRALDTLAHAWNVAPYANELEDERAAACKELFGAAQTVHGDLYQLKASTGSFVGLWINPPYTWDKTGDEKRRELGMLKHSLKWAQPDALVFWCVYGHHVTLDAATFLAKRSSQVDIWRIPGLHLSEYMHVVVVARLGTPPADPTKVALQLVQAGQAGAYPELTMQAAPCYELPAPIIRKSFVFCPRIVTPEAALQAALESGVQFNAGVQALVEPEKPPEKITPVVRPRSGQLALILAAGLFNGLTLDTEKGRMAVRSTVESVEVLTAGDGEVDESNASKVEREVYRTQSVVTITLLGDDGSVDDISGDGPIANFIKTHRDRLMVYLDEHFQPLYNFNYQPLRRVLDYAKGGKLYSTQKHVIAACHTALLRQKSVIMVGEMGVGKSIMGATLLAALKGQMQPGQVNIILCPPHLTRKWEREAKEADRETFIKILENLDDVHAFMDQAKQNGSRKLNIGIVSREDAKLGEGWAAALNYRKVRITRWPYGTPRPTDERGEPISGERIITVDHPVCPTCGKLVVEAHDRSQAEKRGVPLAKGVKFRQTSTDLSAAKDSWIRRVPRTCPHCDAALWTKTRTFSKGKLIKGHLKNPRTPLAEIIATRYGDRLYAVIADELHESKSTSTDQGEAMMILANAATKVIGLTGTLFGGVASSLYGIEYTFNPRMRKKYPWGRGLNAYVRDMGALERIVEYKPQYDEAGVYSGKRRVEQKPREAPGCSPLLVADIIDHCVFVGLLDMGRAMPAFEEIPVEIVPDEDVTALYNDAKSLLGQYLFKCRLEGDSSALGMYLQTLLSWPNAPYRTELCIHRRRPDKESDVFVEIPVHTIPGLEEDRLYAKEQWLIDTVRSELAEGRGCAIFVRQTGERNIQPRIEKLIRDHIPSARPFVLKGTVEASKREDTLNQQVRLGTNVLICNPRLVMTGLDLLDFPTILYAETDYSLYVMGQSSRRAWRLIQDKPCRVYYPYYRDLMEHKAVELIGRKQQAAALLYGENTGTGLSALNGQDGGNILAVLAAEIGSDNTVTDLRDLFARAAKEVDPAESAWFTTESDEATAAEIPVEPLPEPITLGLEPSIFQAHPSLPVLAAESDPLLRMLTEDCGATINTVSPTKTADMFRTTPRTVLPPPRKVKRRRVNLLDAPVDKPLSTLDMLSGHVPNARTLRQPISMPLPITPPLEAVQLALF